MTNNRKQTIFTGFFAVYLLVAAGVVMAQESPTTPEHRIEFIKELVLDIQDAEWSDQTGERLSLGYLREGRSSVDAGTRKGKFAQDGAVGDDVMETKTVDVQLRPAPNTLRNEIRGQYTMTLPNLKLIQLEVDYDIIQEQPEDSERTEFYLEVYEKDASNPTAWFKAGELRQRAESKAGEAKRTMTLRDDKIGTQENFSSHAYNANLTKWAGKEVKLALVASVPRSGAKVYKGRWTQARLMGATFGLEIAGQ